MPTPLTPLIGRGREMSEVDALLECERLVTLTGAGGVGKTRLAQVVAGQRHGCHDVWWVELAGIADGTAIATAALAVLQVGQAPGVDPALQVAQALSAGSLLVLDNCEHVIDDCAAFVAGVLAANTSVSVLATSREPLAVPAEVTWRVPSLDTPRGDQLADAVAEFDAVRLFVDRARRAQPSFALTEGNAPAVAEICRRLDGIPLAIELAAARCRQLPIEHIRVELGNRFRLLSGGVRTVPVRHQTLAASIDWSHDRLDNSERRVFRRLAVFAGPFPPEAAEAVVAAAGDIGPDEVFDLMARLVDRSLVVVEEGAHGELRYRLLETLRTYALERASDAGELQALRNAHAEWWAKWLDHRYAELHTDAVLEHVEEFHDNLKAALDWTVGDPPLGLFLLERLARSWENLGRDLDAVSSIERLLTPENADRHGHRWIAAANAAGNIVAVTQGDVEWIAFLETVEATAARLGDRYQELRARVPRIDDLASAEELLGLARERGDLFEGGRQAILAANELAIGDPIATDLLDIDRIPTASQSPVLRGLATRIQLCMARDVGDLRRAVSLATELARSRPTPIVQSAVGLLSSVGVLAVDLDALRLAAEVAARSLAPMPGLGAGVTVAQHQWRVVTEGETSLVSPQLAIGYLSPGALWFACRQAIDAGEPEFALSAVREQAGDSPHGRAVRAVIEGATTSEDDGWHEALRIAAGHGLRLIATDALEALAVSAARAESWMECLRLLAAAQRLRDETCYRWRFRFEREIVEPARAAAVAALGDRAEEILAAEALQWHDAAAYASRARGQRKRPRHGWPSLTPTERQVVALVAEGYTNPQIAERLLMGRATVKSHLEHVFAKVGVRSRAELAAQAVQQQPASGTPDQTSRGTQ